MFRSKHGKFLPRGLKLLFILMMGVMLVEFLLIKPGEAVIAWTLLIALVIAGGFCFVMPSELTAQDRLINRWYRAAYWTTWIFSGLVGAMFLGAAVVWWVEGLTLEQFAAGSAVLMIAGMVLGLVGILIFGGLSVIGLIEQVTQETREEARRWASFRSRTNSEAKAGPTQEDMPLV